MRARLSLYADRHIGAAGEIVEIGALLRLRTDGKDVAKPQALLVDRDVPRLAVDRRDARRERGGNDHIVFLVPRYGDVGPGLDGAVKAGANIAVSRDEENNVVVSTALTTGVTSVNGKTGDVTVDKESLGLGNVFPIGTEAEQGADFNDLTCGTYMAIGVEGKPCSHSPVSLDNPNGRDWCWALIAISASDGSHCTQIAFSGRDDVAVRLRNKVDGSWKNWKSIYA